VAVAEVMRIGEVATRVGLSLRTLRHWDDVGLVVPSARSAGGFRLYTEADVERLALVKTLKPLDLSLDQMRELLAATDAAATSDTAGDVAPEDVISRLDAFRLTADQRATVLRAQVEGLETLARELGRLAEDTRRRHGAGLSSE
jgi:DNA-binding transcriptional MerR regulator